MSCILNQPKGGCNHRRRRLQSSAIATSGGRQGPKATRQLQQLSGRTGEANGQEQPVPVGPGARHGPECHSRLGRPRERPDRTSKQGSRTRRHWWCLSQQRHTQENVRASACSGPPGEFLQRWAWQERLPQRLSSRGAQQGGPCAGQAAPLEPFRRPTSHEVRRSPLLPPSPGGRLPFLTPFPSLLLPAPHTAFSYPQNDFVPKHDRAQPARQHGRGALTLHRVEPPSTHVPVTTSPLFPRASPNPVPVYPAA